jgi:hypothetical protein
MSRRPTRKPRPRLTPGTRGSRPILITSALEVKRRGATLTVAAWLVGQERQQVDAARGERAAGHGL